MYKNYNNPHCRTTVAKISLTHYNPQHSTHHLLHSSNTPLPFLELHASMEDHSNFLLDWSYFCRSKTTEELTESLLITTMELEAAKFKALEELKLKDNELTQLKQLLTTAINERNEAQIRYQTLLQSHHRRTTVPPPHSVASSDGDEHVTTAGFSSSDCDESIVSSSVTELPVKFTPPEKSPENMEVRFSVKELPEFSPEKLPESQEFMFPVKDVPEMSPEMLPEMSPEIRVPVKELPEKGKFLEAVVKAGPLLQSLLLAGPLPRWRHPPPPLETCQIPPPPVLWKVNKKRGFKEGCDSSTETKYHRLSTN